MLALQKYAGIYFYTIKLHWEIFLGCIYCENKYCIGKIFCDPTSHTAAGLIFEHSRSGHCDGPEVHGLRVPSVPPSLRPSVTPSVRETTQSCFSPSQSQQSHGQTPLPSKEWPTPAISLTLTIVGDFVIYYYGASDDNFHYSKSLISLSNICEVQDSTQKSCEL